MSCSSPHSDTFHKGPGQSVVVAMAGASSRLRLARERPGQRPADWSGCRLLMHLLMPGVAFGGEGRTGTGGERRLLRGLERQVDLGPVVPSGEGSGGSLRPGAGRAAAPRTACDCPEVEDSRTMPIGWVVGVHVCSWDLWLCWARGPFTED